MARARIVTDPKLLPYFLTLEQVAALCQVSPRTAAGYCQSGQWVRGIHWTRPATMVRGPKRFIRDAIVAWLNGEPQGRVAQRPSKTGVNVGFSPALAAAIEREAMGA